MNVILTQNVPHLGSLGDQVRVKDGYARNFLLPRGMALSADSRNAANLAHRRRLLEAHRNEAVAAAQSVADKLKDITVEVTAKAGPSGRLFGSITSKNIHDALEAQGIKVDRRDIVLSAQIKKVGGHTVTVRLHSTVKVDLAIKVIPDTAAEEPKEESAAKSADESPVEPVAAAAVSDQEA
ncbi:MAG: 50S ribosomal protein L9 [Deltaproteobacteria bacterium]|nr:50S ribosomal protein L9 [Deltaproteobacteria bacterium]